MRSTGRVKWWNDAKGYGFILDDKGTDIFVHYSQIQASEGRRTLVEDQRVEFEVSLEERGAAARNVVPLS